LLPLSRIADHAALLGGGGMAAAHGADPGVSRRRRCVRKALSDERAPGAEGQPALRAALDLSGRGSYPDERSDIPDLSRGAPDIAALIRATRSVLTSRTPRQRAVDHVDRVLHAVHRDEGAEARALLLAEQHLVQHVEPVERDAGTAVLALLD